MTKLFEIRGGFIIGDRRDPSAFEGRCDLCGKHDDLRPYGPNDEEICFTCGAEDMATTQAKYREYIERIARTQ